MCQFSRIYSRVMAIDYCQNFVLAQYLENELMKLGQSLLMH